MEIAIANQKGTVFFAAYIHSITRLPSASGCAKEPIKWHRAVAFMISDALESGTIYAFQLHVARKAGACRMLDQREGLIWGRIVGRNMRWA